MDKYTCKNLIIDPETQGLEDIIGKEGYYNDTPIRCIDKANESYPVGILKEIHKHSYYPFCVETPTAGMVNFACIIPKKEKPKPEFIPFTSADEFIDAYDSANYSVINGTRANRLLNYGGIWLKGKDSRAYYMVTEIWDCGLVIDDINMKTFKIEKDLYFTVNGVTHWDELFENYAFLDGSPCGRLKENK